MFGLKSAYLYRRSAALNTTSKTRGTITCRAALPRGLQPERRQGMTRVKRKRPTVCLGCQSARGAPSHRAQVLPQLVVHVRVARVSGGGGAEERRGGLVAPAKFSEGSSGWVCLGAGGKAWSQGLIINGLAQLRKNG